MHDETHEDPNADSQTDGSSHGRGIWVKLAVGVAVLVALYFVGPKVAGAIPRFAEWVDGLGFWGPLVFILGYAVATVAFIPGSIVTMAGGAVFGLLWGTVWVFLGATLGATAAFLVGRYVARDAIEKKVSEHPKFRAIDGAVGRNGLKIVTLLRLSPAFPFFLLNYGLGLTKVRLRDYVLASFGMLPGTLLYVYYGKVLGSVAALAAGDRPDRGVGNWIVLGLGLVATIAVTVVVTRIATRALREAEGIDAESDTDSADSETPHEPASASA